MNDKQNKRMFHTTPLLVIKYKSSVEQKVKKSMRQSKQLNIHTPRMGKF